MLAIFDFLTKEDFRSYCDFLNLEILSGKAFRDDTGMKLSSCRDIVIFYIENYILKSLIKNFINFDRISTEHGIGNFCNIDLFKTLFWFCNIKYQRLMGKNYKTKNKNSSNQRTLVTQEIILLASGVRRGGGLGGGFKPPPQPEKIVVEK